MSKLFSRCEWSLAAFLLLCGCACAGFVLMAVWILWLGPAFTQSGYSQNDIRLNGLAGELTYDCRALLVAQDATAIRALKQDIAEKGGAPLDLSKMGMPPETKQCVIDIIHEQARR